MICGGIRRQLVIMLHHVDHQFLRYDQSMNFIPYIVLLFNRTSEIKIDLAWSEDQNSSSYNRSHTMIKRICCPRTSKYLLCPVKIELCCRRLWYCKVLKAVTMITIVTMFSSSIVVGIWNEWEWLFLSYLWRYMIKDDLEKGVSLFFVTDS